MGRRPEDAARRRETRSACRRAQQFHRLPGEDQGIASETRLTLIGVGRSAERPIVSHARRDRCERPSGVKGCGI